MENSNFLESFRGETAGGGDPHFLENSDGREDVAGDGNAAGDLSNNNNNKNNNSNNNNNNNNNSNNNNSCRVGELSLCASDKRPVCKECGLEDASEGGGRYGTDDHEGLFFCGRCWQSWDEAEKENIMRPLHQQRRVHPKAEVSSPVVGPSSNFFDSYQGGEGADDTEGAWSPSDGEGRRAGALELVGALERPRCVECSNEEGEEGGGRYGHGADAEKFFCGRCWQSWDEEDRRKMMMAYAPGHMDRFANEPSVGCPPPDPPSLEDDFGFDFDDEGDDDLDEYGELDENLEAEEGDAGAQEDSS